MLPTRPLCCVVLLLVFSPLLIKGQEQLLKNGDFQQGTNGWSCFNCKATTTGNAHGGGQAFLAHYRKGTYTGPGQFLDLTKVKPGTHYELKSFVKMQPSSPLTKPQKLIASIRHTFKDNSADEYQSLAILKDVPANKWLKLNSDFILQNFNKPLKELYLYIEGPEPGVNIILDDISLTEVTASKSWKADALKRIESIRKGGLTVILESDKPLTGVEIKIEQLEHDFGFGTAVAADFIQTNSKYRNWYLDNFEWAVLENAMKWKQVEWNKGQLKYAKADGAMKILKDNGKKVRGHAIFWAVPKNNPTWLQQITDKNVLYQTCMNRTTNLLSRYKGRIEHWDVNNEMMAGSFYKDKYGSSSIRYDMFKKARQVDPNAKLFLNDYNVISGGQRLQTYIKMAQEFKSAKVPVDGIGVQGHFSGRPQGPMLLSRLDQLAKLKLPIWVTELDYAVSDNQQRADGLEDALIAFFSHPSVDGVLFWGFYDGRHWKGSDAALVNGANMTPNAAGKMWQRLFHTQWRSNMVKKVGSVPSGNDVKTSARVFYGRYKVTVSINGNEYASRYVNVKKGASNRNLRIPLMQPVIG